MKVFNSRRASVEMSLTQVIGMVLAVMLVLVSIVVISGLMNMLMKTPDEGTNAQYIKMLDAIEALYHPDNKNVSCKLELGYIEPDFAFVGFNKEGIPCVDCDAGETFVEEKCGYFDDNIERPTSCLDRACLCLCHGGTFDVSDEDCFSGTCTRLGEDVKILRTIHDGEADLVLYGEYCGGTDHDVIAGYLLRKLGDKLFIEEVTDPAIFKSMQGPDCEKMAADLKGPEKKDDAAVPETPQSGAVEEALDKIESST